MYRICVYMLMCILAATYCKQLLLTSLPVVLDGLGGVPGGDMDPVLAVSGSERGIRGN